MSKLLCRRYRPLIHHFHTRRDNARCYDLGNGGACLSNFVKTHQNDGLLLRLWQQRDRDLGDNTQHAFRPAQQRQQIKTRAVV